MNHLTVRKRIILGFGAVTLLLVLFGAFAFLNLKTVEVKAASVTNDSLPGIYYASQIETACIESFGLDHECLNGEITEELRGRIQANITKCTDLLAKYESTIFRDKDRALFTTLKNGYVAYLGIRDQMHKVSEDAAKKPEAMKLSIAVRDLVDFNKQNADVDLAAIGQAIGTAKMGVWIALAVGLVIAFVCGLLLLRAITQPLSRLVGAIEVMRTGDFTQRLDLKRQDEFGMMAAGFNRMADDLTNLVSQVQRSGIQVNSSATELAVTAKQQEATANEVAATTVEIGATAKEISATSQELGKTISEVSEVAEQTASVANTGQSGLNRMEETMRNVMEAAASINAKLAVVNDKAGNISQVVTTITKVADQTNLLSLNAAIEAEKAGEQGRGFAVVATEIRRLADQTAVASYDIEQMVKEMQSAVSAGVMGMDKFSEEVRRGSEDVRQVVAQLAQIIQQVQALTPRFEVVNEGMQSQAAGAQQISEALSQLSEAARQTAESLRQSNISTELLNDASRGLQTSVARFKLKAA